jgi:hypothetical protein
MASAESMPVQPPKRLAAWKKALLTGVGFGVGFVLSAALLIAIYNWYSSIPRPRNPKAIVAIYSGVDSVTNRKILQSDPMDWFRFYYVVKNTTDSDYSLDAASAKLMGKLKDSGSLLHAPDLNSLLTLVISPAICPSCTCCKSSIPRLH